MMKFMLKCGLVLLFGLLAGCQKIPQELPPMYVDGRPVHTVPFTQPLEINPDKEQTFYFRFKKPQDIGTTVTVFAVPVFPSYFDKNGDIPKYLSYKDLDRKLIDDKRLKFKLVMRHYDDNGKETAVGLRGGGDLDYVFTTICSNSGRTKAGPRALKAMSSILMLPAPILLIYGR